MKFTARVALLTFVGGAIGSMLRWYVGGIIMYAVPANITINLIGAFAIGFFNGHRWFHTDARRALFSIGFCGGFTTLSAMVLLIRPQLPYVLLEVVLGIGVYLLGRLTGDVTSKESRNEADLV